MSRKCRLIILQCFSAKFSLLKKVKQKITVSAFPTPDPQKERNSITLIKNKQRKNISFLCCVSAIHHSLSRHESLDSFEIYFQSSSSCRCRKGSW
jgi:hypothetical protein